jgi:hypothetical protein
MGIRGRTVVFRGIWSWYCRVAVKNSLPIIVHNPILSGILARGTDLPFLVSMMLVCEGRVIRQRLVASCIPLRPSAVMPWLASSSNFSNTARSGIVLSTAEFLLDYSSQIIKPSDAVYSESCKAWACPRISSPLLLWRDIVDTRDMHGVRFRPSSLSVP